MSEITFPGADFSFDPPLINCTSKPMDGIRVKIGPLGNAQVGAVLKLTWQGEDMSNKPIPDTKISLNHFVTENDQVKGFEELIGDYFLHIKPILNGNGRASYTINGGPEQSARIRVFLSYPNGTTCDEKH
ncbi:hypothetical protein [Pseudomonas sp. SDT291_1_S447]|jgi:hypothetical protein